MMTSRVVDRAWTAAIGLGCVAFFELISRQGWVSELLLPAPSQVAETMYNGFADGRYWPHIISTVTGMAVGFLLACTVGLALSAILVSVPRLERILMPYVIAFQTIPKMALAPLLIIWLGFGVSAKIVYVALVCFLPIMINSLQGFRIRNREYAELAASLGATRLQVFWRIRLPGAAPHLFAGFHLGIIFALIGATVAEIVGSREGLGTILIQDKSLYNMPGVFAVIIMLMAIGLMLHGAMSYLERKVTFWASEVNIQIN